MSERLAAALFAAAALCAALAPSARATTDLDRQFDLRAVGFVRSWDNMDELFSDYVSAAYRDYFSSQSRFVLQDVSRANDLLARSKLPYYKVIEDTEILKQLARATHSASIIRTRVRKEGAQYRFTLEWLHAPHMELMAREEFVLEEPRDGRAIGLGDVQGTLEKGLARLIAKVPFVGEVTGRDNSSVTLNIGSSSGLKPGDTLMIGTLDDVKRHPLLNEIVDWRMTPTGRVVVDQVDEDLSFGHVIDEEAGRAVARYQKVTQIIPRAEPTKPKIESQSDQAPVEENPHLGWLALRPSIGSYSRGAIETSPTAINWSGGGIPFGVGAEGQLWLWREIFVEAGVDYRFFSYGQKDTTGAASPVTAATGAGGNLFGFHGEAGYTYFVTQDLFGPKASVKAGFSSESYSFPAVAAELTGPLSFWAIYVALSGDLPVRGPWGAQLDFAFGVLNGAGADATLGSPTSANYIQLYVGGYYRYSKRLQFRAGMDYVTNNASFSGGSISQNTFAFVPSVVYYF